MNMNAYGSEKVAITGTIDPDITVASTVVSDYMDMGQFESAMAIIMAGTLGSSATLDAKLVQATDSSGTSVKDITGAAITQLTEAGTGSDKQAIIGCRAEDLDMDNDFTHVAISMTIATATSDAAAILLGINSRSQPASDFDLSTVDEIVNV